jgi:heat shock protein HslJ
MTSARSLLAAALAMLTLGACSLDETVAAYGGADRVWVLESLNGTPFAYRATLEFSEGGQIRGQAPCNAYFGTQTAPYPWFMLEDVGATRMACPDIAAEDAFFAALDVMSQSEVSGNTLRLANDDGEEMVFRAEAPAAE